MQRKEIDAERRKGTSEQDAKASPFGGLWAIALTVALAVFFASTLPHPFFVPVVGELLFFGAIGAVLIAAIRREALWSHHVTAWDQAALLALISLVIGLFVDVEAVAAALEQQAAAAN